MDYCKDGTPIDVSVEEPDAKATLSLYPGLNDIRLTELERQLPPPLSRDNRMIANP